MQFQINFPYNHPPKLFQLNPNSETLHAEGDTVTLNSFLFSLKSDIKPPRLKIRLPLNGSRGGASSNLSAVYKVPACQINDIVWPWTLMWKSHLKDNLKFVFFLQKCLMPLYFIQCFQTIVIYLNCIKTSAIDVKVVQFNLVQPFKSRRYNKQIDSLNWLHKHLTTVRNAKNKS